jgi:hypothetical protein
MLRRVALVRTDVSEEPSASFIRVTRIGELWTTLGVTSNRRTQRWVRRLLVTASVVPSSPPALTRATRHNIAEDTILRSHSRENLKSYIGTSLAVASNGRKLRRNTSCYKIAYSRLFVFPYLLNKFNSMLQNEQFIFRLPSHLIMIAFYEWQLREITFCSFRPFLFLYGMRFPRLWLWRMPSSGI